MAPGHYVQGPGAIAELRCLAAFAQGAVPLVCDQAIAGVVEGRVAGVLASEGIDLVTFPFSGEVTFAAVEGITAALSPLSPRYVLSAGGGRTIDVAKAACIRLNAELISIPTVASTDAPAARGAAIYHEDHRFAGLVQMPRNPFLVIADTEIIVQAPERFLVAGMGDALSKHVEAQACLASGARNKHGTLPLQAPLAIARHCRDTVLADGAEALRQARAGTPGPAFEHVVEAIILSSCMSFENVGLSFAHAMAPALAVLANPDTLHGVHAAFGAIIQLLIEGRADDARELLNFCRKVGMPIDLASLAPAGCDDTSVFIQRIAETCMQSLNVRNHPLQFCASDVVLAVAKFDVMSESHVS